MSWENNQAEAIIEFKKSLRGRHKRITWTYGGREPRAHAEWRFYRNVLLRFNLAACAGMPMLPGVSSAFYDIERKERIAYSRWLEIKHARQMDYLCGRRKTLPPESPCF
jgi:hypothetical protein